MSHDIFISYSSRDKQVADAVCSILESDKLRCWIAPRDILAGSLYGEGIIDAINTSRVLVLVFSSHANSSPQVMREVERAVSKGMAILPFRIEDVPMSKQMEYFISTTHWLDALTTPLEDHIQQLSDTVKKLLGTETEFVPESPVDDSKTIENSNSQQVDFEKQLLLLKEEEKICTTYHDDAGLFANLGKQVDLYGIGDGWQKAIEIHKKRITLCEQSGDDNNLMRALFEQAKCHQDRGELSAARKLYERAAPIYVLPGNEFTLISATLNLGSIYLNENSLDKAWQYYVDVESLCEKFQQQESEIFRSSIYGRAKIADKKENWVQAFDLYKELEVLSRPADPDYLSGALILKGQMQLNLGNIEQAKDEFKKNLQELRELDRPDRLSDCLGLLSVCLSNLGAEYCNKNKFEDALVCYQEQRLLCDEMQDRIEIERNIRNQVIAYVGLRKPQFDAEKYIKAKQYIEKEVELLEEIQGESDINIHKMDLALCNSRLAFDLFNEKKWQQALALYKEQEQLYREVNETGELRICLQNQEACLSNLTDTLYSEKCWDECVPFLEELETVSNELDNKDKLVLNKGFLGTCLAEIGSEHLCNSRLEEAGTVYKRALSIWRALDHEGNVEHCLQNLNHILSSLAADAFAAGDIDGSLTLFKENEQTCRELNNLDGIATSLENQAMALTKLGSIHGAMALYGEAESIYMQLENKVALERILTAQAGMYNEQGDGAKALEKHRKALSLLREADDKNLIAHNLINQAMLLHALNMDLDEALTLAEESLQLAMHEGLSDLLNDYVKPLLDTLRQNNRVI